MTAATQTVARAFLVATGHYDSAKEAAMNEVPYKKWNESIDELAQRLRGKQFGELIFYHVKRQSLPKVREALMGTIEFLPPPLQQASEEWIDVNNVYGRSAQFWKTDCAEILLSTIERGRKFLASRGIANDDDVLLNLFQITVLNFAYTVHSEPQSKAFIQKSLGMGFFRRLVCWI
jgi:hypothetical protein